VCSPRYVIHALAEYRTLSCKGIIIMEILPEKKVTDMNAKGVITVLS
jgi:hypothetical protein